MDQPPRQRRTVGGFAALKTAAANNESRFGYDEANHGSAGWRLKQPGTVAVRSTPKFRLSADDIVFTMGSCFARNVENSLLALGVRLSLANFHFPLKYIHPDLGYYDGNLSVLGLDVDRTAIDAPPTKFQLDRKRLENWIASPEQGNLVRSVLNKYSPLSMLNEFQRLFQPMTFRDPFKGIVQVDPDHWFDPQIKNTRMLNWEDAFFARSLVESATATVTDATAMFFTLGFTETWLDSETGYVLNIAPPPMLTRKWPARFRFFNATHAEVLDSLEEILKLAMTHVRPDVKIIVTVSPVPLGTTFTDLDVISANAHSKATLRSAAGEFCARHANVDYFPSYEMVMSSDPATTWQDDRVHVTTAVVDAVIKRFVDSYFGADALNESMVAKTAPSAP